MRRDEFYAMILISAELANADMTSSNPGRAALSSLSLLYQLWTKNDIAV